MTNQNDRQGKVKVLNLYAGIGGNRKLWENVEVTAVENDPDIAKIYADFFPDDTVIVDDAHQYLLDHYKEFDFIWSSPPCPTHSRINFMKHMPKRYPDMKLYEEIIFLKHWFEGRFVVENVRSYYKPLIQPQELQSHFFWANFHITPTGRTREKVSNDLGQTLAVKMKQQGIDIKNWYGYKADKRTLINNMIEPELGLHVFNSSQKEIKQELLL